MISVVSDLFFMLWQQKCESVDCRTYDSFTYAFFTVKFSRKLTQHYSKSFLLKELAKCCCNTFPLTMTLWGKRQFCMTYMLKSGASEAHSSISEWSTFVKLLSKPQEIGPSNFKKWHFFLWINFSRNWNKPTREIMTCIKPFFLN